MSYDRCLLIFSVSVK